MAQKGFQNPTIEKFDGKIEGLWRLIPDNYAIVDISSSGKTLRENGIVPIDNLLTARLVLYENQQKIDQLGMREQLSKLKIILSQRPNQ